MKKISISLMVIIFIFNIFYPAIYAVENEINLEEDEEIIEQEEIESEEIDDIRIIRQEEIESEETDDIEVIEQEKIESEKNDGIEIIETEPINSIEPVLENEIENITENNDINVGATTVYIGECKIESPAEKQLCVFPNQEVVKVSGWAISNDTEEVLKIYVNGVYWKNITKTVKRSDILNEKTKYGSKTDILGFEYDVDISAFPEGIHSITVDQVSRENKVLSTSTVQINVKRKAYSGESWIDTPTYNQLSIIPDQESVKLSGWAISNDSKSVVKLYVNDVYWENIPIKIQREDVYKAKPNYASQTDILGFEYNVDISMFQEGRHAIKIEQVARDGTILSTSGTMINVKHKEFVGESWIDAPLQGQYCFIPSVEKVLLDGWAISNDSKSVVKLYVNGVYWKDIPKIKKREDVLNAKTNYGSQTDILGFSYEVDIREFPIGKHEIKIENVSRDGKVMSTSSVMIEVNHQLYSGESWIDTPEPNSSYKLSTSGSSVKLSGWAISDNEETDVRLYVNGAYWNNIPKTVRRPDVLAAKAYYNNKSDMLGFSYDVDITEFPEGTHEIKIEQVSKYGDVISRSATYINVTAPDYTGAMNVEDPIENKRYRSDKLIVKGWALSEDVNDSIAIYLNGTLVKWGERKDRPDVLAVYSHNEFGGKTKNPKPGFYAEVDTSALPEGSHYVTIINFSRNGKVIQSKEIRITISNTQTWGIDVSHHNGNINWDIVKSTGINFAILKIGEYHQSKDIFVLDDTFETNYNACKARGIEVGGYVYSYEFNTAEAIIEANHCLNVIRGKSFELPIFFDVEDYRIKNAIRDGRTSKQEVTNGVITFCEMMNQNGFKAGTYTSRNFFYENLDYPALEKYAIWVAHYGVNETDYKGRYDLWQYTSTGNIAGIDGNVDLNWCYKKF